MNLPVKIAMGVLGGGVTAASSYGIYELARPKTVGEKLLWRGKVLLNNEETNTTDDGDWDKLIDKHKDAGADKIANLSLDETSSTSDKKAENRKKLKAKCKELLKKKLSEFDWETNLKNANNWCIKDSEKLKG